MYTLTLKKQNNFYAPDVVEISGDKILLNDVILPRNIDKHNSYNPRNVKLYVIGHEFGAVCAIWASHEQDAMDEACNSGMLDCFLSEAQDYDAENLTPLGNASELFDLSGFWLGVVELDPARDIQLIVDIVRGTGNQQTFLEE